MAAQVVKRLPEGDDWTYELKFDGYRALIIKDQQRVELRSRKNRDLAGMYPGIAAAGQRSKADPRQPYGIRPAMSRSPLSIAGLNVFNSAMRVFRSAMRRRNRGTIISSERSMLAPWFSDTDDKPVAHS
jgi:ATP dependent DNA ligase domain